MSSRWNLPYLELVLASRLFAFLVIGAPILWSQDRHALVGLGVVGLVWVVLSAMIPARPPTWVLVLGEGLAIGFVVGWFAPQMPSLMAAVAFPPLTAALWRGARGMLEATLLTATGLLVAFYLGDIEPTAEVFAAACTWLITGVGVGLLAATFARVTAPPADPSGHYREARALIRDLTRLSTHLSGGLDAAVLAGDLLDQVSAAVPTRSLHVHGVRPHRLVPLASRATEDTSRIAPMPLVEQVAQSHAATFRGTDFALPVTVHGVCVAVVSGHLPTDDPASRSILRRQAAALEPVALRLDTALMFSELREAATAGERNRLAREIHDGIAQEIASMGYFVDALTLDAEEPMRGDLIRLRQQLTTVVGEIRRSVTMLRTQVAAQESLGAGIAALARHLSDSSGVPITVTVDERTSRLRHEVEAELLRIAQEAMNNAVKHSQPHRIDVVCRVSAPSAYLSVADDGIGLQGARADSHGLAIMTERASLIGADLYVGANESGGTTVRLTLGTPIPAAPQAGSLQEDLL